MAAGGAGAYAISRRNKRRKAEEERAALDKLRVVVDEDITAYGEKLERLDFHPAEPGADDAMRGDYERALDSYESAKTKMAKAEHPSDVRGVTQSLEDGRYSLAVLEARRTGRRSRPAAHRASSTRATAPRSPTCSGPPPAARPRVPVCGADEIRLTRGEDPMSRTVDVGDGNRRPYWEAGPAYGPWAYGYFGGGLLPGLLVGTMLGSMLATPAYASEYGGGDFGGGAGGEWGGGDFSGSDFDSSGFGGFGTVAASATAEGSVAAASTEAASSAAPDNLRHKAQGSMIRHYIMRRKKHAADQRLREVATRANVA